MKTRFGVTPVIEHYGCIVDLLGKAGRIQEAYQFILAMPIKPDAILLRSLCNACSIYGETVMGEEIGKALLEIEREDEKLSGSECEDYVALSKGREAEEGDERKKNQNTSWLLFCLT